MKLFFLICDLLGISISTLILYDIIDNINRIEKFGIETFTLISIILTCYYKYKNKDKEDKK